MIQDIYIIEDEEISNYIPNFRQEAIIVNYKSSYRNENDKVIDGGAEIIINPAATSVINMDGKQVTYYINMCYTNKVNKIFSKDMYSRI